MKSLFRAFIVLAVLSACATRRPMAPMSQRCGSFCEEIRSCARKAGHADLASSLCTIARCETGDKCTGQIRSPNGLYFGAFQFSDSTWKARCPRIFVEKGFRGCQRRQGMQDSCCATICAAEIIADGGLRNWPACSRRLPAGEVDRLLKSR